MKQLIYILALPFLVSCSTISTQNDYVKSNFSNEIITDSILAKIPTITYSKFELNQSSNKNIEQKYSRLTQNQFNFFFTKEEQKKLSDYYSEFKTYFLGKKKLGNEKLAIFLICDADYMGIFLDCAVVDSEGKLNGKFNSANFEIDAGYLIKGEGEFLNDSIYQYSVVSYEYLDSDHRYLKRDSLSRLIEIGVKSIQTKNEVEFPSDTIMEESAD